MKNLFRGGAVLLTAIITLYLSCISGFAQPVTLAYDVGNYTTIDIKDVPDSAGVFKKAFHKEEHNDDCYKIIIDIANFDYHGQKDLFLQLVDKIQSGDYIFHLRPTAAVDTGACSLSILPDKVIDQDSDKGFYYAKNGMLMSRDYKVTLFNKDGILYPGLSQGVWETFSDFYSTKEYDITCFSDSSVLKKYNGAFGQPSYILSGVDKLSIEIIDTSDTVSPTLSVLYDDKSWFSGNTGIPVSVTASDDISLKSV